MKNRHTLGEHVRQFFQVYLPQTRTYSRHTVLSYRDAVKLFLAFAAARKRKDVASLEMEDLDVSCVLEFLDSLEKKRRNSIATRNIRRAALRSLFRYVAGVDPVTLDVCQKVLGIPVKRGEKKRPVEYLEPDEMASVLACAERSTALGRRDYALLSFLYNTGARVSEVIDLRPADLQLSRPYQVRLRGKGHKERVCPLWPETATLLRRLVEERGVDIRSSEHVFVNCRKQPLTRFGVAYVLTKYVRRAAPRSIALARKRIHPHVIRHTTAVHLLRSGVDINTIRSWLGHANLSTTNRYAEVDLVMKRAALEKGKTIMPAPFARYRGWDKSRDLMNWLASL